MDIMVTSYDSRDIIFLVRGIHTNKEITITNKLNDDSSLVEIKNNNVGEGCNAMLQKMNLKGVFVGGWCRGNEELGEIIIRMNARDGVLLHLRQI